MSSEAVVVSDDEAIGPIVVSDESDGEIIAAWPGTPPRHKNNDTPATDSGDSDLQCIIKDLESQLEECDLMLQAAAGDASLELVLTESKASLANALAQTRLQMASSARSQLLTLPCSQILSTSSHFASQHGDSSNASSGPSPGSPTVKVPAKKRPRPASDLPAASDDGSDDDDVLIQASDDDDDVLVQSGPVYKRARTEGAPVSSRFKENDVCEMLHVDKEGGKWVRVRVLAVEPGGVRCVFLAPTRKDMKTCRFLQQGRCRFGESCAFGHGVLCEDRQLRALASPAPPLHIHQLVPLWTADV